MFSTFVLFAAAVFLQARDVSGAKNGIVGFGIPLYEDPCSLACHDSLSSLYLSCTTFPAHHNMSGMSMSMDMDMDMEMKGTTSEECRTSNMPWLQTMAYCIQRTCGAHGYSVEKQAKCFSIHAVAGASEPAFYDCLPDTAPTVELPQDAMWLNFTSLVNHELYHATHGTLEEFAKAEYTHSKYSLILYLIVIGACLVWGVKIQLAGIFPDIYRRWRKSTLGLRLQQHITLPALFGSRQLEPLPANLGYVPGRALGISISIYVILNVIFSSVSFRSFQPNIYFPSQQFELCEYVGNRTGILSLVNISISILFAGRNNILIAITGWSQNTFLAWHRWTARVATVQAIVHSIAYTVAYWWGIIGTIALGLATAFAILPIRITFYELFLAVHIVLVVLALIACWYHLVPHFGFKYGYQVWLYISFAFWSADRLVRLARIVYYNRPGDAKAIVEAIPGCNILQVTVFPRTTRGIGPGQHTFLYFPGLGRLWESHPFSIAAWETHQAPSDFVSSISASSKDNNIYSLAKELGTASPARGSNDQVKLAATRHQETVPHESQKYNGVSFRLLIRAHSGMTATLQRHLSSPSTSSRAEISVYTEGYYAGHNATHQPLLTADTVLCVAGGLGITHALSFVQEYANAVSLEGEPAGQSHGIMRKARRFILAWSAKEITFIDHVRNNFLANAQGVESLFWCTGATEDLTPKSELPKDETREMRSFAPAKGAAVTVGRMHIASVIRSSLEAGQQTTVLVCGPAQMADEARKQVVSCVKDGFSIDLVEEAFAW